MTATFFTRRLLQASLLAVVAAGCSSSSTPESASAPPSAPAAAKPEPSVSLPASHVSINEVMVAMVDNAGHVLWDAEKPEFKPRNDADWLEIQDHAVQLAGAATLIQVGGTGQSDATWAQDPKWREDAQKMGDAAAGAKIAAAQKNLPALVAANSVLVESCESCHKAFKPDLPTEGIVHQRPHSESHRGNR